MDIRQVQTDHKFTSADLGGPFTIDGKRYIVASVRNFGQLIGLADPDVDQTKIIGYVEPVPRI